MRILCTICISFSTSIFLSQYLLPRSAQVPAAVLCLLFGAFGFFLRANHRLRVFLISAGLSVGFLWNFGYHSLVFAQAELLDGKTEPITATVLGYPQQTKYGFQVNADIEWEGHTILTRLYLEEEYGDVCPGDRLSFTARFQLADKNHDEITTNFTSKGIFLRAYQENKITVTKAEGVMPRFWPVTWTHMIQTELSELFPEENAAFLQALLTGDRGNLSDPFQTALSRTGMSHAVAVSGMHLSYLVGFLFLLSKHRKRNAILAIPIILFFIASVGYTPSVVRAGVMQLLILAAQLLGREDDAPTSISFALAFLLLLNPFSAASISLQLSFASIIGIFWISPNIYDLLIDKWRTWSGVGKMLQDRQPPRPISILSSSISSSIGATLLTVPLVAIYFNTISLVSLIANLLVLWAVSIAFVGGLLSSVLGLIWLPLGKSVAIFLNPVVNYITGTIRMLADMPFAAVYTIHPYTTIWLIFTLAIVAVCYLWPKIEMRLIREKKERSKVRPIIPAGICICCFCIAMFLNYFSYNNSDLTITTLDVGQGQSVIFLSGGYTMMVDCGSNGYENAGDIAANYLQGMGIYAIDLLVLTHFHDDHANGVEELFARMEIRRIALPDIDEESELRSKIMYLAGQKDTEIYFINQDSNISLHKADVHLFPPLGTGGGNEEGLTALCSIDQFHVLVTGDMDSTTEKRLIHRGILPDIDVLIVGHHGSKNSTCDEFLDAITPEYAIISVGQNSYGHPADETIARLQARNIEIYRTDLLKQITLKTGKTR